MYYINSALSSQVISPSDRSCRSKTRALRFRLALACIFSVILWLPRADAQAPAPSSAADQTGVSPYQSLHGGDIDSIGLTNGTLTINTPFLSYPQRGKLKFDFNLMYNNQPQHLGYLCLTIPPQNNQECNWKWEWMTDLSPLPIEQGDVFVGWAQQMTLTSSGTCWGNGCPGNSGDGTKEMNWNSNWSIQMADGSKHLLGNLGSLSWTSITSTDRYSTQSGPFESIDATGWRVNQSLGVQATSATAGPTNVVGPDGVSYTFPAFLKGSNGVGYLSQGNSQIEDPNGNLITGSSSTADWTDSLGRQIPLAPNAASSGNTSTSVCPVLAAPDPPVAFAVSWTPPGYNGGQMAYTFCYATITINMPPENPSLQPPGGAAGSKTVLQSIVLPNGQTWKFEYNDPGDGSTYNNEPVLYGSVTKITFPTGGTTSYTWETVNAGNILCQNGGRWVATRSRNANDGTGSHTWTYTYNYSASPANTIVTDPLGNDVVHTFGYVGGCSLYETQTQFYQGSQSSGTLLKTVNTTYSGSTANANVQNTLGQAVGAINVVPTNITTVWPNGQTSEVTKTYDSGFSFSNYEGTQTGTIGIYGKVISESAYDYGSGAAGALLRTTNTSYAWQSPNPNSSSYLANNLINLPHSIQTCSPLQSGETADCGTGMKQRAYTFYGYDESSLQSSGLGTSQQKVTGESYPGNQTSVQHWLSTGTFTCPGGGSGGSNGYLLSKTVYFDTGMVSSATDPCNHGTSFLYSGTYWGAFPTTVTNALSQQTTSAYDFNTGVRTSTTDPNQLITSYSYDSLWRLQQTVHPDSASDTDTITRQELTFPVTATVTSMMNTSQSSVPLTVFDGLGRVSQTQHTSDPQGTVYVDKTYDELGRLASVSNPYRTGTDATSNPGTTTYTYDALGRKTQETLPDNSIIKTAYCGPSTLVTDPTGKWRRSRVDGLGRMVEVDEPNSTTASVNSNGCPGTNDPIWITSYTFDARGNLTQIMQNGSHQRNFTYDSLSRLLTSVNPENSTSSNPVTYTYNPDSTVLTKTDARGITATYSWDALHRETGVTYSNGDPSLTFTYDGTNCLGLSACQNIGHRTGMTDGAGSELWAYQVDKTNNRNIHREQRTTNSSPSNITKTTTYYQDFQGNVTQIVYPTGRTVNYAYDSANRPSSALDGSNGITYAADWKTPPTSTNCTAGAVCYTPQGSVYAMSIGQSSSFTGFNISETFTNRLQPNELKASSSAGSDLNITYNFVDPASKGNAGVVYAITNNLNSSRSQTFTYDQLTRITSAGTSATTGTDCWGYQYSYDAWGNLLSQAGWTPTYSTCSESTMGAVTADGNNHLSGFSYDTAGNTLGDGNYAYTWDAESQLKTAGGVTYTYDGDGRRAAKVGSKLYWYGSGGDILAETDASGNTLSEYVYFDGKRVAIIPAGSSPRYYAEDFLGSSRVIIQSNGTLCYDADFTPFGAERAYTNTCSQNYKFEGKERDTETGNDDFGAREYSWRFGRWLSSDWSATPVPVPYANLSNPQTLNLYAMVSDDPESFADLDGHRWNIPGMPGSPGCVNDDTSQCTNSTNPNGDCDGFWTCFANALKSDNVAGIGRQDPGDSSGTVGAATGDFVATVQGAVEVLAGGASQAGGVAACGTGVGCLVTAPAVVAGTAAELHGSATAIEGFGHLFFSALKSAEGAGKEAASEQRAVGESKSTTPVGKSSSGQDINAHGEKLGPSGRPVRHNTEFSTVKRAKDAARQAGKSAPVRDVGHFHATDRNGEKLPNAGHFSFPD